MKPIIRSKGVNKTEEILSDICDRTFLKLYVYPNVYKKQGKELCDLLVVFENNIFIFSVKDIKFNEDKHILTAWDRWKRKAIDESMKQIHEAEKWILSNPDKIFLNAKCDTTIPFKINTNNLNIHRIVVAHGAGEACKNYSKNNIYGSLGISYAQNNPINFPFILPLEKNKIFHVLDDINLHIILNELDTVMDLLWYFQAKEEVIQNHDMITYSGEEDLLANYLSNFDDKNKKHLIGYAGIDTNPVNSIAISEGEWKGFLQSKEYKAKKIADKNSYFWDKLLNHTFQNALDNTLLGDSLYNNPNALNTMVKEPRFMRREFSNMILERLNNISTDRVVSAFQSFYEDKVYVILILKRNTNISYDDYRIIRRNMLEIACGSFKNKSIHFKGIKPIHLKEIIGIAFDAYKFGEIHSEDFLLMDCNDWSKALEEEYELANKDLQFFNTPNLKTTLYRPREFPDVTINSKKRRTGRNEKCPCGSNKKYKKCCLDLIKK